MMKQKVFTTSVGDYEHYKTVDDYVSSLNAAGYIVDNVNQTWHDEPAPADSPVGIPPHYEVNVVAHADSKAQNKIKNRICQRYMNEGYNHKIMSTLKEFANLYKKTILKVADEHNIGKFDQLSGDITGIYYSDNADCIKDVKYETNHIYHICYQISYQNEPEISQILDIKKHLISLSNCNNDTEIVIENLKSDLHNHGKDLKHVNNFITEKSWNIREKIDDLCSNMNALVGELK